MSSWETKGYRYSKILQELSVDHIRNRFKSTASGIAIIRFGLFRNLSPLAKDQTGSSIKNSQMFKCCEVAVYVLHVFRYVFKEQYIWLIDLCRIIVRRKYT